MHGFLASPLPHRKAHHENLVTCTVDAQEMSTRGTTELPSGANMHLAVVAVKSFCSLLRLVVASSPDIMSAESWKKTLLRALTKWALTFLLRFFSIPV